MNDFLNDRPPAHGTEGEWEEARFRLEAYLRALQLADQAARERIVAATLQRAAAKSAQNPGASPLRLTMNEFRAGLDGWFARLLGAREHGAVSGLPSCFALDATTEWPELFLADEAPADFQRALLAGETRAAPELSVSSMVPQPFDNALQDAAKVPAAVGEALKNLAASRAAKAAALVLSGLIP